MELKIIKLCKNLYRIQTIHMTGHHNAEPLDSGAICHYLENKIKDYKLIFWELEKMYKKAKKQGYETTRIHMYELMINQKKEHDYLRDEYIKFNNELMEVKDV